MQTDFTRAKNQYDTSRQFLNQSAQPIQGANALTSLGKILQAYFASKGMRQGENMMGQAETEQKNARKLDLAGALGAYRQDPAYKMDDSELFPGEKPIQGLYNQGTGNNVSALAQSLMGSEFEDLQNTGMKTLLDSMGGGANISARSEVGGNLVKGVDSTGVPFVRLFDGTTLKGQDALDAIKADEERKKTLAILTAGGKAEAVAEVKGTTEPQLQSNIESAKLEQQFKWKSKIAESVKVAESLAAARGEALTDLARMEASLPSLMDTTASLKNLAQTATYTLSGRAFDTIVKELGFGSTEGATSRAKFQSVIDNQILPLLRETFGAAFTAAEGDRLRATLGDVNATPEAKVAAIDAFIDQKVRNIKSKKQQVDNLSIETDIPQTPTNVMRFDAQGNLIQ